MKFRYITIEREYGSGGTKIARRLSEACGVPCYGHEILEAVAKKQGIPVERINQYEEKATGSVLYTMFVMSRVQTGNPDMLTAEGKVFLDEQLEIRRLATAGPAIFLGHCACDALKDQKGVVKVFIQRTRKRSRPASQRIMGSLRKMWNQRGGTIIKRERGISVPIQEMTGAI